MGAVPAPLPRTQQPLALFISTSEKEDRTLTVSLWPLYYLWPLLGFQSLRQIDQQKRLRKGGSAGSALPGEEAQARQSPV